jgi:phospholipase C
MRTQLLVVVVFASLLAACAGGGGGGSGASAVPATVTSPAASAVPLAAPAPGSPIKHVIVVIQENRTLDNLFSSSFLNSGGPYPGANVATRWTDPTGASHPLAQVPFEYPADPDHSHTALLAEEQEPGNLGFIENAVSPVAPEPTPPAGFVMANVPDFETIIYHELAATYALADNMYSSRLVPTFPGHLFLISGQSTAADDPLDPGVTSYNGANPVNWGCDSPAGTLVPVFTTGEGESPAGSGVFPCFNYQTIGDLMDAKGVSWKYYTGELNDTIDAAFDVYDAIQHIRFGRDWYLNISTPETNIISDIQDCRLPNVAYVTPPGLDSDHAGDLSAGGPGWVGSIYLAIVESSVVANNPACQYYGSTAIIVTWDDSGGWYDHVTPPEVNGVSWGFRVPLIVASAWAQHGAAGGLPYVSHTQRDFGSIIRFIENNWKLGTLGQEDATADNLSDMFNYSQTPVTPITSSKMRSLIEATRFNLAAAAKDRTPPDDQ